MRLVESLSENRVPALLELRSESICAVGVVAGHKPAVVTAQVAVLPVVIKLQFRRQLVPPHNSVGKSTVALAIWVVNGMVHAVVPRCLDNDRQQP